MTLTEMRTAVRTRLGNPSTDGFFSDANLTDIVNEGLQVISTDHDWPWLFATATFSTAASDADYAMPATWLRTRGLIIDGYDPLTLLSTPEIRAMETATTGQPEYFTIDDDQILLRPVPDGVYSVIHDYVRSETALSGDSDTPLMPLQFHYSIVASAVHLAHLRQGDMSRAGAAAADRDGWLQRMRSFKKRAAGPRRVVVRPFGAL